jgi:hypothetical protein
MMGRGRSLFPAGPPILRAVHDRQDNNLSVIVDSVHDEVGILSAALNALARAHGLRGAVLVSFTAERVGICSYGVPQKFGDAMQQLADRILAKIDDGELDPELDW